MPARHKLNFKKVLPNVFGGDFVNKRFGGLPSRLFFVAVAFAADRFSSPYVAAAQQNLYDGFAETAFGRQCRLHASLWDKRLEALADTPRRSRRKRRYASFCLWYGSLRQSILKQRSARRYVKTIPICHDTHFWRNYPFFSDGRLAATARGVRMLI